MKTILVIEDEHILLNVICYKLGKEGYHMIKAQTGMIAMKHIVQYNPDMILVDIMIPDKNGFEVISFVRNDLHRDIPIVIISCLDNEPNILEGFRLGADDYVTKPFILSELMIRIKKLFICHSRK